MNDCGVIKEIKLKWNFEKHAFLEMWRSVKVTMRMKRRPT